MNKKSIRLPFYGLINNGKTVMVINTKSDDSMKLVAKTLIEYDGCMHSLQVTYNYDCSGNTYEHSEFTKITRKEFLTVVKKVKEKHGVNITVKY